MDSEREAESDVALLSETVPVEALLEELLEDEIDLSLDCESDIVRVRDFSNVEELLTESNSKFESVDLRDLTDALASKDIDGDTDMLRYTLVSLHE